MNNLLFMLTLEGGADKAETELSNLFYTEIWPWISIVLWILTAVLAIVFVVKAITTALAVIKAADEPQVRQEKIAAFKYLAIGLGIAIVVLSAANLIIETILEQQVADLVKPGDTPTGK